MASPAPPRPFQPPPPPPSSLVTGGQPHQQRAPLGGVQGKKRKKGGSPPSLLHHPLRECASRGRREPKRRGHGSGTRFGGGGGSWTCPRLVAGRHVEREGSTYPGVVPFQPWLAKSAGHWNGGGWGGAGNPNLPARLAGRRRRAAQAPSVGGGAGGVAGDRRGQISAPLGWSAPSGADAQSSWLCRGGEGGRPQPASATVAGVWWWVGDPPGRAGRRVVAPPQCCSGGRQAAPPTAGNCKQRGHLCTRSCRWAPSSKRGGACHAPSTRQTRRAGGQPRLPPTAAAARRPKNPFTQRCARGGWTQAAGKKETSRAVPHPEREKNQSWPGRDSGGSSVVGPPLPARLPDFSHDTTYNGRARAWKELLGWVGTGGERVAPPKHTDEIAIHDASQIGEVQYRPAPHAHSRVSARRGMYVKK